MNKLTLLLLASAVLAFGQGSTISARPGLVNYFEGEAFLNGAPLSLAAKIPSFVEDGSIFSTRTGKAEILLMPGAFLRLGDNSQISMLSSSIVLPRFELTQGEAMLEVIGLLHGSQIQIIDQGAGIVIEKDGLYRFTAGGILPTAAVIQGSAEVTLSGRTIKIGKGRQAALVDPLQSMHFDLPDDDALYAWSSVRSQYEAAANYDAASRLAGGSDAGTVGWFFNDLLGCWAWLPGGRFFSPFGWGFYSPVTVGGATVVRCPVHRGGHWHNGDPDGDGHRKWVGAGTIRPVAISPKHPPSLLRTSGFLANGQARPSHSFNGGQTRSPETHAANHSSSVNHSSNANRGQSTNTVTRVNTASHASSNGGSASHASTHSGGMAGGGGGGASHASGGGGGGASHAGSGGGGGGGHASGGASSSSSGHK